ncbi:MAG TPA: hypothetical protein VE826_10700, partial [Dongiaceae bacterium]|nr:hypothetical protein [Dongiaceae bacterium]
VLIHANAVGAPVPSLLVATPTFLMYAEGDRRQPAVASTGGGGYRVLSATSDGTVFVSFDDGAFANVETITPALTSRKLKMFPRGTTIFPATDGFLAYEPSAQLVRRYDARGSLIGAPVVALGATEALGVADAIVTLGNGRLRTFERSGRERREINLDGNSLTPLPDARFAVYDARDGEVRAYTAALEQTAQLRYVGLPVRALASAPDGALAVLAGTPACVTSNAEIDVFTDLHAQPAVRIHGIGNARAIAVGTDTVYAVNAPCGTEQEGSVSAYGRDGTPLGTMRNMGTPTSIIPFRRTAS